MLIFHGWPTQVCGWERGLGPRTQAPCPDVCVKWSHHGGGARAFRGGSGGVASEFLGKPAGLGIRFCLSLTCVAVVHGGSDTECTIQSYGSETWRVEILRAGLLSLRNSLLGEQGVSASTGFR